MAVQEIVWDIKDRKLGVDRSGNLIIKGGVVQSDAAGEIVSLAAATATVTQAAHAEREIALNRAAGVTVTLPAAAGTGATFRFVVGTTVTSNNYIVQVANASDYMRGKAWLICAAQAAFATANTGTVATESDTVTMNGTTKGGLVGDVIEFRDIAANVWQVECSLAGSGTAATPFSVAV